MDDNSLASELLHEIKRTSQRWFIMWVITIFLLFATNAVWLYAWCLPTETSETSVEATDCTNAILNGEGEVHINGSEDDN